MPDVTQTINVQADAVVSMVEVRDIVETLTCTATAWAFVQVAEDLTVTASGTGSITDHYREPATATGVVTMTSKMDIGQTLTATADGVADIEDATADPSLVGYLLYHATGSNAFNFNTPDETFSSFPHTTSLTLANGTRNRFVIRRRNQYGLISRNLNEHVIVTDGSGTAVGDDPSPPEELSVTQVATNTARAKAVYYAAQDGDNAATHFVYTYDNGLGIPSEIEIAIGDKQDPAQLDITGTTEANGTTVTVTVWMRRKSGGVDFDSTTVSGQVTISTSGPSAPSMLRPDPYTPNLI